jgi:hypothetical protein
MIVDDQHPDGIQTPPGVWSLVGDSQTSAHPELLPRPSGLPP